ncbi:hypothetical protein BH23ACT5_BH23ACT5_22320 [soil metagenome]
MTAASFMTAAGVRVPAITTEQMRRIDQIAIEETGPNLYQMMENAGRSLALTVMDQIGESWASVPIAVLAGTGGNGGGGIAAARHLANRGADVTLVLADADGLGKVSASQLGVYRGTPGRLAEPRSIEELTPGLVVDALLGYSLIGTPRGRVAEMIQWISEGPAPTVSLDVPSGIDATTGETPGPYVRAATTMTLALPKTGLDVGAVGELWLADIGIPEVVYRRVGIDVPPLFGSAYLVRLS